MRCLKHPTQGITFKKITRGINTSLSLYTNYFIYDTGFYILPRNIIRIFIFPMDKNRKENCVEPSVITFISIVVPSVCLRIEQKQIVYDQRNTTSFCSISRRMPHRKWLFREVKEKEFAGSI